MYVAKKEAMCSRDIRLTFHVVTGYDQTLNGHDQYYLQVGTCLVDEFSEQ
jgi:hypothetical protein